MKKSPDRTMLLLLDAAGERINGITIDEEEENTSCVLDYLDKREINIKELSREAIRNHLLNINCYDNLFARTTKLGLPKILTQYRLLPPAYVVRREGYVLTRVCLSVHRGGQSANSAGEGVSPTRGRGWGGSVSRGGGVSWRGVSQLGGGSGQSAGGGVSQGGSVGGVSQDSTTERVLTTRRAVCLLRSRRRNFLFNVSLDKFEHN